MPGSRGGPRTPSPGRERVGGAPAGAGRGGPREGHHQARRSRQRPPAHISQDHSAAGTLGDMHGSRTSSRKRRQQTPEPRQRRPPCGPPSPPARPSRPCSSPPCPGASTGLGWGHRVAGACVSWASLSISTACTPDSWPWRLPLLTRRLSRTCVHVCISVCTRVHVYTCSPAYARLCGLWLLGLGLNSEELFCKLLVRRGGQRLVPPGDRPQRAWGPPRR